MVQGQVLLKMGGGGGGGGGLFFFFFFRVWIFCFPLQNCVMHLKKKKIFCQD